MSCTVAHWPVTFRLVCHGPGSTPAPGCLTHSCKARRAKERRLIPPHPPHSESCSDQVMQNDLRRARAAAQVLRSAFPQLERLRIELSFVDASSISPASQVHTLYPAARAFFTYRCPHSDCGGEFELADIIRTAVSDGMPEAHGALLCTGLRPGEKGSKRACELRLVYAISAHLAGDCRSRIAFG